MKKFIYNIAALAAGLLLATSCSQLDEGTTPGTDGEPRVTAYIYGAELPYDGDCDCRLRVCTNSKGAETYYLAEETATYEANVASMGEQGYYDHVVATGTKLTIGAGDDEDVMLTGLVGEWTITIVTLNGNRKGVCQATFTGANWIDIVTGTYTSDMAGLLDIALPCTLQQSGDNPRKFRLKNAWGTGQHISLNVLGTFSDGTYAITMDRTATAYSYGSYGTIYMTDYATYKSDNGFVGYNCLDPETGEIDILVMYYVAAGYLGNTFDKFTPDAE